MNQYQKIDWSNNQFSSFASSSDTFFAPIRQARAHLNPEKKTPSLVSYVPRALLAACAAALTLAPSKQYAKEHHLNSITVELSCFLTGLLINLYAINRLADEIKHSDHIRANTVISFVLGALTSLPVFFIQQVNENNTQGLELTLINSVITLSSVPIQTLGFLEFTNFMQAFSSRFYWTQLKQDRNKIHEFELIDLFINTLEQGFKEVAMNPVYNCDLMNCQESILLDYIIQRGRNKPSDSRLCTTLAIFAGFIGIVLAETVNLSYVKATQLALSSVLPNTLASLFTAFITFPAAVLSAEFGFNAMSSSCKALLNNLHKLYELSKGKTFELELQLPHALHKTSNLAMSACLLLLVCQSYSVSVQFNNLIFKDNLSRAQLAILNQLTIPGTLLFNFYALNQISGDWLCQLWLNYGSASLKQKTERFQLGQAILSAYKEMPVEISCAELKSKMDSIDERHSDDLMMIQL